MAQFPVWTNYYGGNTDNTVYNGTSVPIGSVIEAYKWDGGGLGAKVGSTMVSQLGAYGYMAVTNQSGLSADDPLAFYVNHRPASSLGPDSPTFAAFYESKEVNLNAEGVVAASFTAPANQYSSPGLTVTFGVTADNSGNGLDFYKVTSVSSANGWQVFISDEFTYVDAGNSGTIEFDVAIPYSTLLESDEIEFTVASGIDPSVSYTGTVQVLLTPTDVDDDIGDQLPGAFRVMQNYPNPFNPSTKIAFELPRAENVTIEIFDLLGGLVERTDMGRLSAGRHTYDFDASALASGIYLYRVKAGEQSELKKMTLLK